VILGLTVHDPRLSFPPTPPSAAIPEEPLPMTELQTLLTRWPDEVAASTLWDAKVRQSVRENMISERALCRRRQKVG
jgi:hypothetical protein